MPTVAEIFGRYVHDFSTNRDIKVRDHKINRCQHIDNTDEVPFIKRCPNGRYMSLKVCRNHAYSVNFVESAQGKEKTVYFDSILEAEKYKKAVNWLETNYPIPKRTLHNSVKPEVFI